MEEVIIIVLNNRPYICSDGSRPPDGGGGKGGSHPDPGIRGGSHCICAGCALNIYY